MKMMDVYIHILLKLLYLLNQILVRKLIQYHLESLLNIQRDSL